MTNSSIHETNFNSTVVETHGDRVFQRSRCARWQSQSPLTVRVAQSQKTEGLPRTQVSKPKTEREKLYQKVQDIHNYKAEYKLKCEAEAALESDLYRLGQIDGGEFAKADPTLWHEWSYRKGYGVGIEEYHDLVYAS